MSPAVEIAICVGAMLGYIVIGGVVYEILARFEAMNGAEPVTAAFWPLFIVIGMVVGFVWLAVWLAVRLGAWCGAVIVDGVEHVIAWRRRTKLPRATAREKGARR